MSFNKTSSKDVGLINNIRIPSAICLGDDLPGLVSDIITLLAPCIKIMHITASPVVVLLKPLDQEFAIGHGLSTDTWFKFTIPASSATEPCPSIVPCEFNMIKHTGSSNYNVAGVYYYYSS